MTDDTAPFSIPADSKELTWVSRAERLAECQRVARGETNATEAERQAARDFLAVYTSHEAVCEGDECICNDDDYDDDDETIPCDACGAELDPDNGIGYCDERVPPADLVLADNWRDEHGVTVAFACDSACMAKLDSEGWQRP